MSKLPKKTSRKTPQLKAKSRGLKKPVNKEKELIVIDEKQGLIFENEKTLFGYFNPFIEALEDEYIQMRLDSDFTDDEQIELETYLEATLDDADEVWVDTDSFEELPIYFMIKSFEVTAGLFKYVAACYFDIETQSPSFVFLHFPTRDNQLVENYRRNECIFHKKYETAQAGAIEGDSLVEGDPIAMGLYESMSKVRSETDIPSDQFKDYSQHREPTIEDPDEIWRKVDINGNVLVTFISSIDDGPENLHYVVVTQEEETTQVHSLLFSFPTTDTGLVDRYRQGENLQADEVSQESSH